jgi:solute carrier family 25 (mitochondrial carnitine/acylcarnitine transporter), member 20/29
MIKCNQQINFQGKTKKENRFIKKTQHIFRKTGLLGFYRGLFATANRDILSTGLYFQTYYGIKSWYKTKYNRKASALMDICTGAFTGWLTWIVTYPFDTVKTIIQVSPLSKSTRKQKFVFRELLHQGGVRELYRGAVPAMTLSVMFTSLTFLFFEISRKFFGKYFL